MILKQLILEIAISKKKFQVSDIQKNVLSSSHKLSKKVIQNIS
jgi:hypothetical protein